MAGFAVGVRMEPAGGFRLIRRETDRTGAARGDNRLRAAILFTTDFQAVPVDGCRFRQFIDDIHSYRLTAPQFQRGAQQVAVISPGLGGFSGNKHHLPLLNIQGDFLCIIRR